MNKQKLRLERRHFLQMVGASALTYPFLRGVPSFAAASGTPPTYVVLVFTPCGCVRPFWGATDANGKTVPSPANGSPATSTTNFMLRNTLMPFSSLQKKIIILDGLHNKGAGQGSHEAGMASLWTGLDCSSGNAASGISIDQQIVASLNPSSAFKSVQLMVRSSADFTDREVKTRMIYDATGAYVDPIDDPVQARDTLFPPSAASSGPDKTTFIRQQLFNSMNTELTALQSRLCTEDKNQLQALQSGWNSLNTQLMAAATASQSCSQPEAVPSGYQAPSSDFPTSAKLQMDFLAFALACNLTQVASLQFSTATSQVTHTWLGSNQTDTHHDYSHNGPTSFYSLAGCPNNQYNNMGQCANTPDIYAAANQNLYTNLPQQQAIDNWYAQQVAYFAQKLDGFTGANGGTVLDQGAICWGSELDMGAAHNHDDTPFLVVGGANGQLKTGQMLTFPMDLADAGNEANAVMNHRAHNDLLLTLAKVMGVNLPTFGEASLCTGPIAEMLNS